MTIIESTNSDVLVRMATSDDIPELLRLYKQLQPQNEFELNSAEAAFRKAATQGVTYFVAEIGGILVATCYIAIIPNITWNCASIGFIENCVVDTDFRRRGVGRRLINVVIEFAKARGCYKATLQSGNGRTEAHHFYESCGFNGDSKRAYELRF
ncbi:MAG: GNAT family N-acetyltransferase [Clostridiales Family XIII bacterium]|jgi:GNAT superfamily N-acetyltransferase|nr:GNAT family N-acetyltransferase [Clostridiales Family XIII bacterium]